MSHDEEFYRNGYAAMCEKVIVKEQTITGLKRHLSEKDSEIARLRQHLEMRSARSALNACVVLQRRKGGNVKEIDEVLARLQSELEHVQNRVGSAYEADLPDIRTKLRVALSCLLDVTGRV